MGTFDLFIVHFFKLGKTVLGQLSVSIKLCCSVEELLYLLFVFDLAKWSILEPFHLLVLE